MIRHKSTAILLAVLIAVSVFATGFAGAASASADSQDTSALAAGASATNITVSTAGLTTHGDNHTTSYPGLHVDQNITLDNGTNYHFRFTNDDTGQSVRLAIDESATTGDRGSILLLLYEPDGSVSQEPRLWVGGEYGLNASVVSGSIPQASGLTNFSAALLDANGTVIGETETTSNIVGYEGRMSQNSTTGNIRFSVPRDTIPRSASAKLELAENASSIYNGSGPLLETSLTYDANADSFTTVIDASQLERGNYTWVTEFNWNGDDILRLHGRQLDEQLSVTDGTDGNGTDGPTNESGVNVKLSPSNPSVETNGTATYDVVVENVDAGVGSIGYDVTVGNTSVGTVESVSVNSGFPSTFTTTELASNGSTVSVQVAGGDTADTGTVTVGNVTLRGHAVGTATVDLSVDSVGDENGSSYTVAGSQDATLTVRSQPAGVTVVGGTPSGDGPGQFAGDGVHQDVNGDGSVTLADVTALFKNYNSNAVQNNPTLFDYNGDGSITLADVTTLFNQVSA